MDKYLMSSPTQLSQPFISLDPHMDDETANGRLEESPNFDDMDFAADLPELYAMDFDGTPQRFGHSKHFSVDGHNDKMFPERQFADLALLAPFSLNAGSRFNFGHLRNLSLDDRPYERNYDRIVDRNYPNQPPFQGGHSHLVLVSADPPLGMFTHLVLTTTLHLNDLVPQLSLLALNPLLLDSPYLAIATTTPARRRKSASISSMYATPMRNQNPSPGLKVGKTPMKAHRRTRLKATVEPGLAHLLATIANMKSSSAATSATNPFEMAFLSPKVDAYTTDCDATPLATPAKAMAAPLYFTPISQNRSFSGLLLLTELSLALLLGYLPGSQGGSHGYSSGPQLRRQDTFDLIKIEDQDDDACKQLRKAKSFTTFLDPSSKLTRIASLRNFKGEPSPKYPEASNRLFRERAAIDLLLPELMAKERTSSLKSYPASIDLASITNSGVSQSPPPSASGGLLPPIAATRSSSSIDTTTSHKLRPLVLAGSMSGTGSRSGSVPTYPTATQIQETSATEEIAKFAEQILNSDSKRPIIVQTEENAYDPKKKHKCPLCLARFQRPEHVKRHLKSHSTDKPFQCDWPNCGRRFNRKDNLKAHLKKIHKQST